jgi:hypothetical protein
VVEDDPVPAAIQHGAVQMRVLADPENHLPMGATRAFLVAARGPMVLLPPIADLVLDEDQIIRQIDFRQATTTTFGGAEDLGPTDRQTVGLAQVLEIPTALHLGRDSIMNLPTERAGHEMNFPDPIANRDHRKMGHVGVLTSCLRHRSPTSRTFHATKIRDPRAERTFVIKAKQSGSIHLS